MKCNPYTNEPPLRHESKQVVVVRLPVRQEIKQKINRNIEEMDWLNFEKQEKGFKPFNPTRQNIIAAIGKRICYLTSADISSARGICFVRYGTIESLVRNELFLTNGDNFNYKRIIEAGIKLEEGEML